MSQLSLEKRVESLEQKVRELFLKLTPEPEVPWWQKVEGMFADDPAFDEAMRLGREYRESLRPKPANKKSGVKKNGDRRHRSGQSDSAKK